MNIPPRGHISINHIPLGHNFSFISLGGTPNVSLSIMYTFPQVRSVRGSTRSPTITYGSGEMLGNMGQSKGWDIWNTL